MSVFYFSGVVSGGFEPVVGGNIVDSGLSEYTGGVNTVAFKPQTVVPGILATIVRPAGAAVIVASVIVSNVTLNSFDYVITSSGPVVPSGPDDKWEISWAVLKKA
jgi:hypothetical protein